MRPGVALSSMGWPIIRTCPAVGCGWSTTLPRVVSWGLVQTSATLRMRPHGTPARPSTSIHSATVRDAVSSTMIGTSTSRCFTRSGAAAKRGSSRRSGRPTASQ